ncbi:uncharacterized protein LOC111381469 [Olea europaea var. sylvestris]|uniref:uncharacterized protein LOC111381469 n=1 Tax=Olea europaea var. sylvestris TaxID=158386 RepID=UPI000C1CE86E|nr:uncharacterized protein LOC111381469 [Olea europaea var. sylvestris]
MTALWEKFFRLKQGFRWWNRHVFGDIFQRVWEAEVGFDETEILYDRDPTPEHCDLLHHAQAVLNRILSIEEGFWKQKASSCWVCEGDHNTRYFHTMVQGHRIRSRMKSIRTQAGKVLATPIDIQTSAMAFYQNILSASPQSLDPIRPDIIPRLLTVDDNMELNCPPLIHEEDVYMVVLDFFYGGHLPRGFSATTIVLFLKKDVACRWTDFRPINLCTVFNKLITKLLNTRLSALLPRIISP